MQHSIRETPRFRECARLFSAERKDMLSSSNFVSPKNKGALMQHQPSVNSPATPACASHSSSVSADGIVGVAPNVHADDGSIPQSVKGAPEHLRPVIRKRQNSEVRFLLPANRVS